MIQLRHSNAAEFLVHHSDLVHNRNKLPALNDVLLVGESTPPLLAAMMRLMFGYDLNVRSCNSLGSTLDAISSQMPDLIFLDQALSPSLDVHAAMPIIRRCGYAGPVLVTALGPTPTQVRTLLEAGVGDVIDRDELDSARIAEALLQAYQQEQVAAE